MAMTSKPDDQFIVMTYGRLGLIDSLIFTMTPYTFVIALLKTRSHCRKHSFIPKKFLEKNLNHFLMKWPIFLNILRTFLIIENVNFSWKLAGGSLNLGELTRPNEISADLDLMIGENLSIF